MKLRLSALTVLTSYATMALATDFEEDGIAYNFVKLRPNEVEVTQTLYGYSGNLEIPSTVTHGHRTYHVTRIGDRAFEMNLDLESVSIPASVNSIGEKAFESCWSLMSVNIPDGIVTINEGTFSNCYKLGDISIPESVTSIKEGAFFCCSSLTSIKIPSGVRSIGASAFSDCQSLVSINIPDGITEINDFVFNYCESLTAISLPVDIRAIGKSAFNGCTSLRAITIPESVSSIGAKAFEGCSALKSVSIPAAVESIGNMAFADCKGLETISVATDNKNYDSRGGCNAIVGTASNTLITGCQNTIIPEDVVSIENHAFFGCMGLTSVSIPQSVRSISNDAFSYCITSVLEYECVCTDVYVYSTTPPSTSELDSFCATKANTLHVPEGTKAAYEAALGWRDFHIVDDIERPTAEKAIGTDASGRGRFKTIRNGQIVIVSGRRTYSVLGAEIK